jgi:hypothetical protein
MNRADLQTLAELRAREAKLLFDHGFYQETDYLSGDAIECALKACIAKRTQQFDFPDKKLVSQVFAHNLASLLRISGMDGELQKGMQCNLIQI